MKVKEFTDKYKKLNKTEEFVKERITKTYLPYAEKLSLGKRIVKASMYTNTEPNMFKINTLTKELLSILSIVQSYTDIEIDFNNVCEEYDMFVESNGLDAIMAVIPEREVKACVDVIETLVCDEIANRDLVSWLDTKFEAIKLAFDSMMDVLSQIQMSEE